MKTAAKKRKSSHAKSIAEKRILLLGIGNVLMSDEGLGVRAIKAIGKSYHLPRHVKCVDGGTAGLGLLELIKDFPIIIIVDALLSGSKPGTILRLDGDKIPKSTCIRPSAHGLGVKELLGIAEFEGFHPKVIVIGMEPKDVSAGLELTLPVKRALPLLIKAVIKELKRLGATPEEKECTK